MANKIQHAVERETFKVILNKIIEKGQTEDIDDLANSLVNVMEKVLKGFWPKENFDTLHKIADDPNSKWKRYADRVLKNSDKKILSTFLLDAGYEGGFRGFVTSEQMSKKYQCNVPWIILMDPTSACNMHCIGCWAAEYGYKQNLSYELMDRVLTEGEKLGVHACLFTGGEPLVRKNDIIRLCEAHPTVAFHAFTNGTLIDDEFCKEMLRVGNFMVSISIEGFEEANDSRRGKGHFQAAMKAMDLMRSYRIPFGVSICYTSRNYKDVTSDEFLDMLIDKGCIFAWYFHYMPVGMNASTDLLLTPEQRKYMKQRVRFIRDDEKGKELFAIDFQNDGEYTKGCIAGGKRYLHINAAGDVEPCVFIHYSNYNIKDHTLLECLKSPLFMEYYKGQPFNENHLRPCPMLENPAYLREMVKRSGAHSTDLEAPEDVDHLCDKTMEYAEKWAPEADAIWNADHPGKQVQTVGQGFTPRTAAPVK